jgi:NRPS condensation-like uncharacterized protein
MDAGVRLNLFQRMMLRWRELHPYNPVHAVRVPAVLEPGRLRDIIAARLAALGLTGLVVDERDWRFRYEGGPAAVELAVAAAGMDPQATLAQLIEGEFNRPFASGQPAQPFRFTALDEGASFQLVLVYDHYVASGDSMARLLTGIACAYLRPESAPDAQPMERYSATYRSLFLRHPWWALRAMLGLPRMVANARRAYRPRYAPIADAHNAYTYLQLGPPQTRALLRSAKAWGITLNELLMASLMLALSPLAAGRRQEARRNELAVASILSMRRDFGPDALQALSPFLAAFRVSHPVPEGIGLQQLAQEVHLSSAHIRRRHLYLQSIMALGVSGLLWPWLSQPRRQRLYPKHFPVWAGITSLNLGPIWARAPCADTVRLDYLRAVPTGPLCPLVLAVTTAHEVLHLGIAFRTAAFSREQVDTLVADLGRRIEGLQAELPA